MFKLFSRPITVIRRRDGYYNDSGDYIEGSVEQMTIQASVQPLKMQELSALNVSLDGNSFASYVKVYSAEELLPSANNSNGDMIVWNDRTYRVIYTAASRSRVIEHYKAIAVEVVDD